MQIYNSTQKPNYNPQFGAIFKFNKTAESTAEVVLNVIKKSTVTDEAQKLEKKFEVGIGEAYVYIPDARMKEFADRLACSLTQECYNKYLTRVD